MSEPKKTGTNLDPDTVQRMSADRLFSMEILFTFRAEKMRHVAKNLYGHEVMNMREDIFRFGLSHALENGHAIIVKPWDLEEIHVWRQKKYFDY
jgi:hypothetical protein